jgi:DNA polymerase-3 subunit gamma/tau
VPPTREVPPTRVEPTGRVAPVAPAIAADAVNEAAVAEVAETVAEVRAEQVVVEAKNVTLQQVKDAWPEVLESVQKASRNAWMVVFTATPLELRDNNVLVISFPSQKDVEALKQRSAPGEGVGDHLKNAISTVLGIRPALIAKADVAPAPAAPAVTATVDDAPEPTEPDIEPAVDEAGWAVAEIPGSTEPEAPAARRSPTAAKAAAPTSTEPQRYGESVVREILGASFIEEHTVAPRVTPREN